jgi:hypothetical protein
MEMENQLVTLEQANQIIALSTESGVKGIVQEAKKAIHNLDGGSMDTASGRKKIRSNAFKATKLKTSLKEKADELIESIEQKIAPELKTIQAIKDNQKILGSDLDQLRKDVNSEVDDHEKELKRLADEVLAKEKSIKDAEEKDLLWDFALMELKVFNIELAAKEEKRIADEVAEQARLKQVQIDNDIRVAAEATVEAERLAQEKIDNAKAAEQKAIDDKIQAKADLLSAQAREKLLAEQQEQLKINNQWLAIENEAYQINANIDYKIQTDLLAHKAEVKRLADIEAERLAGIERQRLEEVEKKAAQDKLEANEKHVGSVRGEIKIHLMNTCGIDEELAVNIVKALLKIKDRVTINY